MTYNELLTLYESCMNDAMHARKIKHDVMASHFDKLANKYSNMLSLGNYEKNPSHYESKSYVANSTLKKCEATLKDSISKKNDITKVLDDIKKEAGISNVEVRLSKNAAFDFDNDTKCKDYVRDYSFDKFEATSQDDFTDFEYAMLVNGIQNFAGTQEEEVESDEVTFSYLEKKAIDYFNNPNWENIEKHITDKEYIISDDKKKDKATSLFKGIKSHDIREYQFYYHLCNDSTITQFDEAVFDKDKLVDMIINSGYYHIYTKWLIKQESHSKKQGTYTTTANTCRDIVNSGFSNDTYYDIDQHIAMYLWQLIETGDCFIDKPKVMDEAGNIIRIIDKYMICYNSFTSERSGKILSLYWKVLQEIRNYIERYRNKVTTLTLDYETGKKEEDKSMTDYINGLAIDFSIDNNIDYLYAKSRLAKFNAFLRKVDCKNAKQIKDIILLSHQGFKQDEVACLVFGNDSKSNIRRVKYLKDKGLQLVDKFESFIMDNDKAKNWQTLVTQEDEVTMEEIIIHGKKYIAYR